MHRQAILRATYYPAGDGYARSYYAAGGFGSFLKKAAGAAVKIGAGYATGGFAGALAAGTKLAMPTPKALSPIMAPMVGSVVGKSISGGGGGGGFSGFAQGGMLSTGGKSLGLTRGEQAGRKPRAINPRTGKPYRHMNPFNFRALKRADRRMHRFAKAVRHFVTVTKTGHAGVKIRHRRRK